MMQRRPVKMGERIAKLEENFDVKFKGHKVDVQTFFQNLFAEFKEEMKKNVSGTFFQHE